MKIIEITYNNNESYAPFPWSVQVKGAFCYLSKTLRFCKIPYFC